MTERRSCQRAADVAEVVRHLRQRGLEIKRSAPIHKTLLAALPARRAERFYHLFAHYGFRIFLRDLIRDRRRIRLAPLCRYVSRAQARSHLDTLVDLGILRRGRSGLRFVPAEVDSLGDTLEWYVAEVLRRVFAIPALWGVTLDSTPHGGDFDILALAGGRLAYMEVKSSPPKHVDESEVAAFLDRTLDLGPDLALFIEDSALRMKDKIVPMFESVLLERPRWSQFASGRPQRLRDELFQIGGRIFIVNSDPDLVRNIGLCLGAYFRSGWSAHLGPGRTGR
ncbi:MAG: hypothetical protein V3U98_09430 [Acidobacteriota bacterium]